MRRSSVVGPLLLIGIGGLFLARNVFPDVPLMDYLSRYWPYLLILWGSLRLVEILVWSMRAKPLPRCGMSGGEWVLVVFLCLIGGSIHAARNVTSWFPGITLGGLGDFWGESYDYPVAGEFAAAKTPKVVLHSFRGNAHITGGDVDKVTVMGRNTIRSLDRAGADRTNQQTQLNITGDANQIDIVLNQNRVNNTQLFTSELDIMVPKGASIEAHGRRGDFDITGIGGSVEIESDNAAVRLEGIGGSVKLNLRGSDLVRATNVKGAIELKGRGNDIDFDNIEGPVTVDGSFVGVGQLRRLAKPLRFTNQFLEVAAEAIPGNLHGTIGDLSASGITGPVRIVSTRNKDVDLSGFTGALELELNRGDVTLRPGAVPIPKMDVHTRNGDIEVSLPEGAKFDLTGSSENGEVINDFGAPIVHEGFGSRHHGGSLKGSNGGPAVSLRTDRGEVTVRKAAPGDEKREPKSKGPGAPPVPAVPPLPAERPEPLRPLNQ